MTSESVSRWLRGYHSNGKLLIEYQLPEHLTLSQLQNLLEIPEEDPMYDCYPIRDEKLDLLIRSIGIVLPDKKNDYFIEADAERKGRGTTTEARKKMTIDEKRIVVLAPLHNTGAKKDATGAFQPEAAAFAKRHGVPKAQVVWIDNKLSKRAMRAAVLAEIENAKKENGPLAALACFCHGWKTGIQFGFDKSTVGWLAQALTGARDVRVALYACSTAQGAGGDDSAAIGGDGGFADLLRDALCQAGAVDCQVDAHTTAGHTTKNPFVRRFQGMGSSLGGAGGYYIVSPSQKQLFTKWRKLLASTDLRYDFPFMTIAEIHSAIAG